MSQTEGDKYHACQIDTSKSTKTCVTIEEDLDMKEYGLNMS